MDNIMMFLTQRRHTKLATGCKRYTALLTLIWKMKQYFLANRIAVVQRVPKKGAN